MFAVTYFVNVMDLVALALLLLVIVAAAITVLVEDVKMWCYRRKLNARMGSVLICICFMSERHGRGKLPPCEHE